MYERNPNHQSWKWLCYRKNEQGRFPFIGFIWEVSFLGFFDTVWHMVKFRYCEEAEIFEKKSPTFFELLSSVKSFQIFVAFSAYLNIIDTFFINWFPNLNLVLILLGYHSTLTIYCSDQTIIKYINRCCVRCNLWRRYVLITYIVDVLWCQPIKLIHVVSTLEFHEYWWNDVDFIFFVPSI